MGKQITSAEYPLSKIFCSDFEYQIPSYQRPYSWTLDQASNLFEDLYDFYNLEQAGKEEEYYFLGSIVLIKEEQNPQSDVVDGQQRLTTLTILLAVLCYYKDRDTQIEKYVIEPGDDYQGLRSSPRVKLRERDQSFFFEHVQQFNFQKLLDLDAKQLANDSQRYIQSNSRYFIDAISEKFGTNQKKLNDFIKFMLTRCYLVAVSTSEKKSAFRIFSVLNNRGLDLNTSDLLKAEIIGSITEEEQENYNQRWENMEIDLGRDRFNELFSFIRMIYAKEKARKAVHDEFNQHVISKKKINGEKLIEDVLEPHATSLSIIKKSDYKAESNSKETNDYLHWLNEIDNSDWIPVAILLLSQQRNYSERVCKFFKKLERLAAYLHVCGKNINLRIMRYKDVINAIEAKNYNFDEPLHPINLTSYEIDEMKKGLAGDIYTLPPRRRNYIMLRLDSFVSDRGAIYNPSVLTIEHVLPQNFNKNNKWHNQWPDPAKRDDWVHKIANLVPLNQRRNSSAQNHDFEKKKNAYFQGRKGVSSYALTSQVLKEKEWTEKVLINRQKTLLKRFEEKWELFS